MATGPEIARHRHWARRSGGYARLVCVSRHHRVMIASDLAQRLLGARVLSRRVG
ncbi:MAG: hypothetical protein U5N55_13755 [Cypionkella sp.]|nr:hypothetical protein [Cypionkella sp.]